MDIDPLLTALLVLVSGAIVPTMAALERRNRHQRERHGLLIVVHTAAADALRRRQRFVLPENLILAALCDPEVAALVASSGANAATLRRRLDGHLGKREGAPEEPPPMSCPMSPASNAILARAAELAWMERRGPTAIDLVMAAMDTGASHFICALLDEAGVEVWSAQRTPARSADAVHQRDRDAVPYRTQAGGAPVDVVLWNDNVSTMEGVVRVLVECFGKDEAEATHLMLEVHHDGDAVVGAYPPDEAYALVSRATEAARAAGMPLRITARPSSTDRPPPPQPDRSQRT